MSQNFLNYDSHRITNFTTVVQQFFYLFFQLSVRTTILLTSVVINLNEERTYCMLDCYIQWLQYEPSHGMTVTYFEILQNG